MIKKADILLLILLLLLGFFVTFYSLRNNEVGTTVKVTVDGMLYGEYSLNKDQEIIIKQGDHFNYIIIKDNYVQMIDSSCKNHICINTGKIKETKDKIVCLPNKVIIEITGKGGLDVITG